MIFCNSCDLIIVVNKDGWRLFHGKCKPNQIWIADKRMVWYSSYCSFVSMMIQICRVSNLIDHIPLQVLKDDTSERTENHAQGLAGVPFWGKTLWTFGQVKLIRNCCWKWQGLFHLLHCYSVFWGGFLPPRIFYFGFSASSWKTLIDVSKNLAWVCKWLLGPLYYR